MSQTVHKRLYSIQEASDYLGRSVWAVREMLWAGKMPYIKDGRRILLDINDMEKWIEKNKTQIGHWRTQKGILLEKGMPTIFPPNYLIEPINHMGLSKTFIRNC